MKLLDCECGGSPYVTFDIEDENLFTISCPICGTSTPEYKDLNKAQIVWNTLCWKMVYWDTEDTMV